MSTPKQKNSNFHLLEKYQEHTGDYFLKMDEETRIEAKNELADKLAAAEKIVKGDISYPDIIYYLVSFIPGFEFKTNMLIALGMYSHFVNSEAAKFGIIQEDLFYARKYLDDQDLYSEKVNGHVRGILNYIEEKTKNQTTSHQFYYLLALLLKEYMLLKENYMKKALIYKMYDYCFDRTKMTALYQPVRVGNKANTVVSNFSATEYVHRSWLTNFKVEKEE
jgi:hypothetical protein